jgi:hypothetical protein
LGYFRRAFHCLRALVDLEKQDIRLIARTLSPAPAGVNPARTPNCNSAQAARLFAINH